MLVLAPDPRLGIAPDRVARVRAVLAAAPGGAEAAPGVVVALPGGADGALDAMVLRPDGVIGLAPAGVRESVGSGAPLTGGAGGAGATAPVPASAELDRLLALAEPACGAPRRVLSSAPDAGHDTEDTRAALVAPVGAPQVGASRSSGLSVDDVHRLLAAFRLADHAPDAAELTRAGFRAEHPSGPAIPLPSAPTDAPDADAPVIPEARRGSGGTATDAEAPADAAADAPADAPVDRGAPVTAPLPVATATGPGGWGSAVSARRTSSRAGDPRPGLPATGRLAALGAPGRVSGASRRGRTRPVDRLRDAIADRTPRTVPGWLTGYQGLAVAAVAAFLVALGLALLAGRAVTGTGSTAAAPPVTRDVGGVTYTRASVASDPTCEGHAYGQAAQFLRERPCRQLDRALWTGTVEGRAVVLSVASVRMADATSASALASLIDTPNTGNVADLLREGRGYPGAPNRLTNAGYASARDGDRAVFVESDRISGPTMDEAGLDALARTGLALG